MTTKSKKTEAVYVYVLHLSLTQVLEVFLKWLGRLQADELFTETLFTVLK